MKQIDTDVVEMVAKRVYNKFFSPTAEFEQQDWEDLHVETKGAFSRMARILYEFYEKGKEHGLLSLLDNTLGS